MRVLVSLTVHEQPRVVVSQLHNLLRYLQDPVIVIHVSRSFNARLGDSEISDRILINPVREATAWGTGILAHVHLLNVQHALKQHKFDYVTFHASNDLFVRKGVEGHMAEHAAGGGAMAMQDWMWAAHCLADRPLRRFLEHQGLASPVRGQLEGSFYRIDVFKRMLDRLVELDRRVSWSRLTRASKLRSRWPRLFRHPQYPREEVYFPTALLATGHEPTTGPYTYMNWNRDLTLSRPEVEAVRSRDYEALPDFDLTPGQEFFAVKQVPRRVDDPLRRYIEGLDGGVEPVRKT